MGDAHKIEISMRAPISFYNEQGLEIEAPESVGVTIFAKRKLLGQLTRDLAVHIDAQTLHEGENKIAVSEKNLLLPSTVKLLNCYPTTIDVTTKRV